MDKETVIEQIHEAIDMGVCVDLFMDVIELLKKQKEEIENLKQTAQSMMEGICLLKEQEKAKVVFGRCKDGSFATECGHCGTYLDKAYSICPKCNKELDWNSNQD